jgi:hypothetical protein
MSFVLCPAASPSPAGTSGERALRLNPQLMCYNPAAYMGHAYIEQISQMSISVNHLGPARALPLPTRQLLRLMVKESNDGSV